MNWMGVLDRPTDLLLQNTSVMVYLILEVIIGRKTASIVLL